MISLKNVTKYYHLKGGDRHYVMRNLTLDIPSGQNIAILGPNGAGKSTLLRLIGGAESPNSGTITSKANISWPLGVGVGFQGSLTGRQNIQFVCKINGLSSAETQEAIDYVLDFSELGKFFENPVKAYSSGMRARLAFGLSIAFDFDYYLIDELTAVGDAIFRSKATKAFEEIKKRATLIFVAHNTQMLRKTCDSAIYLNNGNAQYYEDIEEGISEYEKFIEEKKRLEVKKRPALKETPLADKKDPAKKATRPNSKKAPAKKVARPTAKKARAKKVARPTDKKAPAKKVAHPIAKKAPEKNVANARPPTVKEEQHNSFFEIG